MRQEEVFACWEVFCGACGAGAVQVTLKQLRA